MNKTEMIEAVASETGLAKTEVAKVLNAYTNTIVKTVAEGRDYTVIGFGKFYASQRQARTGRNPSTGAELRSPQQWFPSSRPVKLSRTPSMLLKKRREKAEPKLRNNLH